MSLVELMEDFLSENLFLVSATIGLQLLLSIVQYVFIPLLIANVTDDASTFGRDILYLLGGYTLYTGLSVACSYMDKIVEPKMYEYVTVSVVESVLKNAEITPTNVSTAIENMSIIRNTAHDISYLILTSILPRMVVLAVSAATLFSIHAELAVMVLLIIATSLTVQFSIFHATDYHTDEVNQGRDEFETYLEDLLNNIHIIKSTPGSLNTELIELREKIGAWRKSNNLMMSSINGNQYIATALNLFTAVSFFLLTVHYAYEGQITFTQGSRAVLVLSGLFTNFFDLSYQIPLTFHKWETIDRALNYLKIQKDAAENAGEENVDPNSTTLDIGSIKLNGVSFSYKDRPILDNYSISISPSTITSVYGKSGIGKSTIGKLITGIIQPDKGEVVTGGPAMYIDQNTSSLFDRTVLENILYGLKEEQQAEAVQKLHKIINEYSVDKIYPSLPGNNRGFLQLPAGKYGSRLSGGQKKMIYLLRAVCGAASQVPILVVDEPTTGLDNATKKLVLRMIEDLTKREKKTLVIITHDDDILRISDRVIEAAPLSKTNS